MSRPGGLARFEVRVRVVLVLVVVFLAVLDLTNLLLLGRARQALEASERDRAEARAREVVLALGPEALVETGDGDLHPPAWSAIALKRLASRFGFERLAVLGADGAERAGSGRSSVPGSSWQRLRPEDREALAAGRAATAPMEPVTGGAYATLVAFVPVLGADGRLAAVVEVDLPVRELGMLERNLRLVRAVQFAALAIVAVVVLLFARWIVRPLRSLVSAADAAGLTEHVTVGSAGPNELADAFRTVARKLRAQDEALGAVEREGGGLGDLVRFANQAAAGMSTGVAVVDRSGSIAAINPAGAALLGVDRESARGRPLEEAAGAARGLVDLVDGCLEQGRSVSREVIDFRQPDGRGGHLGVAVSPTAGFGERISGALILMTDLTEIRRLQEQSRLRESLVSVGRLSAGIAHEVRNALGTILGYARMIEKRDDPRTQGPVREIVKEVDAVRAVLDEFLLYARPPEPQIAPVDLEAVVRASAAAAPESVDVEVAGAFGTVLADEGLVRRVFGNLIQNAAEAAGDARRRVSVRITGRPGAGRAIQIEVDDDGPGVPAEIREQIFVPFYTTRARGTGLGLALVQRTVVDCGGSIEVSEGPRGGALFRIRLPLQPAARTATRSPAVTGRNES